MRCKLSVVLTLGLFGPATLCAQTIAPDTPDPGSVQEIASATTEARFLSPWVSYLPASASVVSPRTFLHRIPGAAGELVDSATAYAYCRALAGSSARVRLFTIGRSEEGRDIVLLAISDEQGISELERLRAATGALADRAPYAAYLPGIDRIGVTVSEGFQMHPEQTTDAIICHHPEAKYFVA